MKIQIGSFSFHKLLGAIVFIVLLASSQASFADKKLVYEYYDQDKNDEDGAKQLVEIKDLSGGKKMFKRTIEGGDYKTQEEFVVNDQYETLEFSVKRADNQTDYSGKVQDGMVVLKGMLEGQPVDKTIELDRKPFYYTPKFNLSKFVLSNLKELKFWMLRKDKLTKYLMQAKKEGVETISVNGKDVEAIKVYYSATGPGEKFYKRIYYFRKSDGIFLRKLDPKGEVSSADLTSER